MMIDFTACTIGELSIHRIGNSAREEELTLTESPTDIDSPLLRDLLHRYFLSAFDTPEYYTFETPWAEGTTNAMETFASRIFDSNENQHDISTRIAQLLFDRTTHPNIKSGDLFVASFSDVRIDEEVVDAIGIFKAENKLSFLKIDQQNGYAVLNTDVGIPVDRLDKGCLIFNMERASGYRVCIVDKSNKTEAQFWRDDFLQVAPLHDDFHRTKEVIQVTRRFVEKELPEEIDMNKPDQIDLLNRTADYFKTRDSYDRSHFEDEVLQTEDLISSFRNFSDAYSQERNVETSDRFAISPLAVKQQARILRSVLKLDKNFHVYIHGSRNMIEQGVEPDGRKYYKLYYDSES